MAVLVGKRAPDFTAAAVLGNGGMVENYTLSDAIRGKYAVIFFYPLDFTFVCPTELIAINRRMNEFALRGVEVIGVSIDSQFSHFAWRNVPVEKGGIGQIGYTLVADIKHQIVKDYDVEAEAGVAFRGTFLIDQKGVVRHQLVNDLPLGRNIDEALRTIDALQYFEKHGEVCPAGWTKGKQAMHGTQEGVASYLAEHAEKL